MMDPVLGKLIEVVEVCGGAWGSRGGPEWTGVVFLVFTNGKSGIAGRRLLICQLLTAYPPPADD